MPEAGATGVHISLKLDFGFLRPQKSAISGTAPFFLLLSEGTPENKAACWICISLKCRTILKKCG